MNSPALTQGLCQALLPVAFGLLTSLDSHVQCSEVVFQLKVNGALSSRERDVLDVISERNFVDLGNILGELISCKPPMADRNHT